MESLERFDQINSGAIITVIFGKLLGSHAGVRRYVFKNSCMEENFLENLKNSLKILLGISERKSARIVGSITEYLNNQYSESVTIHEL